MHACVLPALRWLHRHMRHDDRSARHMGSTVVGFQPRAREDAPGPTSAASASAGAGDATAIIASPSPCARASPRRAYARMELAYAALMPLTERAGSSTRRGTARAPVSGHAAETEARSTTRARRRGAQCNSSAVSVELSCSAVWNSCAPPSPMLFSADAAGTLSQ